MRHLILWDSLFFTLVISDLITVPLQRYHPPGVLVEVGVAVVLQVGRVLDDDDAVSAVLRAPAMELIIVKGFVCNKLSHNAAGRQTPSLLSATGKDGRPFY